MTPLNKKTPKNNDRRFSRLLNGANDPDRTDDLFITNELLYQLSYVGLKTGLIYLFEDMKVKSPLHPVASNENDTEIRCRFHLTPIVWGGRG